MLRRRGDRSKLQIEECLLKSFPRHRLPFLRADKDNLATSRLGASNMLVLTFLTPTQHDRNITSQGALSSLSCARRETAGHIPGLLRFLNGRRYLCLLPPTSPPGLSLGQARTPDSHRVCHAAQAPATLARRASSRRGHLPARRYRGLIPQERPLAMSLAPPKAPRDPRRSCAVTAEVRTD